MENVGGIDDQSSGWLEVKRKNRINSKLTVHNVSGPSSSKSNFSPRYQPSTCSEAVERPSVNQQSVSAKVGTMLTTGISGCGSVSALKEVDKDIECFDKQVVKQETGHPVEVKYIKGKFGMIQEACLKENLDKLPKIKWGDLEDDDLTVADFSVNGTSCSMISCADSTSVKVGALADFADAKAHGSSYTIEQNGKREVTPEVEKFPDGMLSSHPVEDAFEGNWKEVNEISPVRVGLLFANEKMDGLIDNPGETLIPSQSEHVGSLSTATHNMSVDGLMPLQPSDVFEDGTVNIHEIPSISTKMSTVGIRDIVTLQEQGAVNHAAVDAPASAAMEENLTSLNGLDDNIDAGEGDLAESKERFRQRLWCFLFENLNRAVDELYLLCELECDMEQIKEAILVFEESALDFKELKFRVERFDNTKRFSSESAVDGMLVNGKEHRRPHALSWEVRRMTTSPHRAEILSSSLEAFKRIQLERAARDASRVAEVLNLECQTSQNAVSPDDTQMIISGASVPTSKSEQVIESGMQSSEAENNKKNAETNNKKQNIEACKLTECRLEKKFNMAPDCPTPFDDGIRAEDMNCRKGSSKPQIDNLASKKDKVFLENRSERHPKSDLLKRQSFPFDKEKEKRTSATWKSMDAWKEKRNWEDILKSPSRNSSKVLHSAGVGRKHVERARNLHDKLMSPEKKKKTALDMKREAEEKHARATRIRSQLENERVQRLQRTSEKLSRVNEWQAVRSLKLREGMHARQQRSESRHEAYLAQVAKRAGDESSKVNEVRFITSLNEENKKLMLRQKLHDYELRRAEKLQIIRTKQKEDTAKEEAVFERRKLLEAEKLQRLAETQRKKEEAQLRREEERKASSAAREARAVEQLRRKEDRAKAQQEEAELLAQKLAEKLNESEQRRKFYLEQIRERASMDFRDQSSPLLRRSLNKEGQGRSVTNNVEDYQVTCISDAGGTSPNISNVTKKQSSKRRVKKIRQRLMALKDDFIEPAIIAENAGFGCRASLGAAKMKIGRWLQDLQRLRQARKEGFSSIGLIVGDIIKFLDGKEIELHASRQAGLIDFIASALPASHTTRPDASQVTIYLLRLLRVVLTAPANRSYFLSQNLLPPIIPMLSAYLENYIKAAASSNLPGNNNLSNKVAVENLESVLEILDGLLWTVTAIIGHAHFDERNQQMQDGLAELVVAYQVINHLRDLFALYDRPQVEGSPFPSAILLSLKLLAVLTSRPKTISSIDWEDHLSRSMSSSHTQETLLEDLLSLDLQDSSTIKDTARDSAMPRVSHLSQVKLDGSDTREHRQLDVIYEKDPHFVSLYVEDCIAASENSSVAKVFASNEITFDGQSKILSPYRNKNNADDDTHRNNTSRSVSGATSETKKEATMKQPVAFLMSAIAETGLVSLPSLLTAVLLQANNRLSSDQSSYNLPSNFEEVCTGVLKILNNLALLDVNFLQNMLGRPDLKMEFFHLMSFLLSHCTSKWKAADDQIGFLLLESLSLLGYFALFHPGNQAVLHWGKSPTILHKICDLPFVFFSDPELAPILAGTIVASCYGCDQNRGVVQQEVSLEMLLSLLKSCRHESAHVQPGSSTPTIAVIDDACDNDKTTPEAKKSQLDIPLRSSHKSSKSVSGKGVSGCNSKLRKSRIQKDYRGTKGCSECPFKTDQLAPGSSFNFLLHARFPSTFLDKAEEFFAAGSDGLLA